MKIKVLIVEDEVLVADDIASSLETDGYEVTGIAISSEECLASISTNAPHVILMDINIKGSLDGIDTAKKVGNIPVIFISSNTGQQFISRALETSPHAFISKPYNYRDVSVAIELAFKKHNELVLSSQNSTEISDSIFVKKGDLYKKILFENILYIEASGSYCEVCTSEEKYTLSFNLNHFQNNVQNKVFKRIHRSYVVNLNKVESFDKGGVSINGKYLPVSTSHRDEVFNYFNKLF